MQKVPHGVEDVVGEGEIPRACMTRTELYSACSTLPALESMSVPSTSGCLSLRPVGKACVAVVSPDTLVTPKLQKFSWKLL